MSMFEAHELRLQALVKNTETPVLGLLGTLLSDDARNAIRQDLAVQPSVKGYCQRLAKFPALFGVWLAEHVMLGLGQDGHFSLYPHIQKAIGISTELTPTEKDLIWRSFRRAMFKLGIEPLARISGSHFMADEYVRQAGVPIAFADDLALRMIQMSNRIGIPDIDDQEALITWQSTLLNKLTAPFSVTARKAIERDSVGYYSRIFARVYLNGGLATSNDRLENTYAKAFANRNTSSIRRATIPQLLYRDGVLGILFPSTDNPVNYNVECGGNALSYRIDVEGGFRSLSAGLHRHVVVEREDGERVLSVHLWSDSMSNRLLIFSAEGRLRASATLAQENPVELTPGKYIALCRFEPSNFDEWYEVNETPLLVEVPLDIRPSAEVLIKNGPASVTLLGQNQPSLSLLGSSKISLEGLEFWYGDIQAEVEIPSDWIQNTSSIFEIRINHGDRKSKVKIQLDKNGRGSVKLIEAIKHLGLDNGLWRIVLELGRVGEARTTQRRSIFYWNGLKNITYGLKFSYESTPKNLISTCCIGIKTNSNQLYPKDDHSRLIRISFDLGDKRLIYFSWHKPGIFVEIQMPNADGSTISIPRPIGSTETVSLTSPKKVVVSASEPGYLSLGNMRTFVDFSQKASKSFPASFLASRLEPSARTLKYETVSGNASTDLLVLSLPHVTTNVKTERIANLFEIRIVVRGEPTDIAINGIDLSSGREARAEHELMLGSWHTNDLARMQVYASPAGNSHIVTVLIDIETIKAGIWIFELGARIGGVWGRLQDEDEGRIAVVFAVDALGKEILGKEVVAGAHVLEIPDAAAQLVRLNKHFRQCWSSVCWEQQQWLTSYFSALVEKLRDNETDYVTELIEMAMCKPPEDGRLGYLSLHFAPALLNHTFTQQRAIYKRVNSKKHPLSIALRAMVELKGSVTPAFGKVLHQAVAMSFENAREIIKCGRRPKRFNLLSYREMLQQTKIEGAYQLEEELFLPDFGELLGTLHLLHSWKDLERGFLSSQIISNSRKNTALALAKKLARHHGVFEQSTFNGLRGQSPLILIGKPHQDQLSDSEQLKWEHMEHIALANAWLAWFCRLEHRQPNALNDFHSLLSRLRRQVEVPTGSISDCIAYYIQIAPAMFAYYLLLWELVQTVELDPVVQND